MPISDRRLARTATRPSPGGRPFCLATELLPQWLSLNGLPPTCSLLRKCLLKRNLRQIIGFWVDPARGSPGTSVKEGVPLVPKTPIVEDPGAATRESDPLR